MAYELANAVRPSKVLDLATAMLLLATSSTLNGVAAQQATSVCTATYDNGNVYYNGGNEYMCVDWSVGSAKMEKAEDDYADQNDGG